MSPFEQTAPHPGRTSLGGRRLDQRRRSAAVAQPKRSCRVSPGGSAVAARQAARPPRPPRLPYPASGACWMHHPQQWTATASIAAPCSSPRMVTPDNEHEQDGQWTLTLVLPSDLIQFDDHFRKAPVLPGFVQAGWALALAAPRLGTSPRCREMEALKFQRLLRPGDRLELSLRYEAEPGSESGKLHFAYRLAGSTARRDAFGWRRA